MDRKEAIEIVKRNYPHVSGSGTQFETALRTLIPELKESEDERIRRAIRNLVLSVEQERLSILKITQSDILSWLEKQGEKKNNQTTNEVWKDMRLEVGAQASGNRHEPQYSDNSTKLFSLNDIDEIIEKISEKQGSQNLANSAKNCKVEPKFKVSDWVINTITNEVEQIIDITDSEYICSGHLIVSFNNQHLLKRWTIQDAKDGDVLVGNYDNCKKPWIGIFKCISKDRPTTQFDSHCFLNSSHHIFTTPLTCDFYNHCKGHTIRYALPATKEQRDLLFQKMKEAGYEWDAEKKELRKIEQKPTIIFPKFRLGDKIRRKTPRPYDKDMQVARVESNYYVCNHLGKFSSETISFSEESNYELVEQNHAWSEEDDKMLNHIICDIESIKEQVYCKTLCDEEIHWLKSLKERYTWKPSDEQMMTLEQWLKDYRYKGDARTCYPIFDSLYNELKKLKG